ncbi:MAG: hypothetical protein HY885_00470 [Deltaproteobacteria bacterium]|nr:hypothetical protein [Deltaproteobacteria bacterium]
MPLAHEFHGRHSAMLSAGIHRSGLALAGRQYLHPGCRQPRIPQLRMYPQNPGSRLLGQDFARIEQIKRLRRSIAEDRKVKFNATPGCIIFPGHAPGAAGMLSGDIFI